MEKKTVLYLSYDGMTDPLGQSQVLPYLRGLSEKGYAFHLISFEKPARYQAQKELIQKLCDGAGIVWYPLMYTKKPPVFSTFWDVRKMRLLAFKLQAQHAIQLVHCRSYISALVGLSLKQKKSVKFIFDMRGFWANERVDGKLWDLKNPIFKTIYAYFKKKEKLFFTQADATISLTHRGKKEIESWNFGRSKHSEITVIPCCADLKHFDITEKTRNEPFTMGYLGALGTWYMLDEMLDFFSVLLKHKPQARFHILTKDDPKEVFEKASGLNIPVPQLVVQEASRNEIPVLTSTWDFSLFFIRPSYSKLASSPTKQGELMGMGIPVICNTGVGDVDTIVEQSASGVKVSSFSKEAYEQAIITFLNTTFNPHHIRNGAQQFYDLKNGVEKYSAIYARLLP